MPILFKRILTMLVFLLLFHIESMSITIVTDGLG